MTDHAQQAAEEIAEISCGFASGSDVDDILRRMSCMFATIIQSAIDAATADKDERIAELVEHVSELENAAGAIWGTGDHKCQAAEERMAEFFKAHTEPGHPWKLVPGFGAELELELEHATLDRDTYKLEVERLQSALDAAVAQVALLSRIRDMTANYIDAKSQHPQVAGELWRDLCDAVLAPVDGKLTLAQAKALNVCRICGEPYSVPFTLNCGREFAHTKCLEERNAD